MRCVPALPLIFAALAGVSYGQLPKPEPPRGWKSAEGKEFQGTLLSFDGTTAIFKMANGQRAQAPLAKLSAEDQQYLAEWQKKQPIKINLPDVIGVETAQIKTEVVSEDPAEEKYIYRTQHFEFESQGRFNQSLLREVARNFEATYELLRVLPWNVEPKPASGDFFRARLLKDRSTYLLAGGLPNSGGVYSRGTKLFLVPFESIGVKTVGKGYAKDENFDYSTMVHELTHQMMHFSLDLLPQWMVEGTAEYTSNLPLHTGKFRVSAAKNGLKDYMEFLKKRTLDGIPEPYPLESLFNITNAQWNMAMADDPRGATRRLYFTSYLLVYYFMHLDGAGDGQRFVRFFREISEARKQEETFEKEMEEFFKKPGVKRTEDGFTYPGDLKLPKRPAGLDSPSALAEFQKKNLQILLDGRSTEELMKQIRSAYAKLGIRL